MRIWKKLAAGLLAALLLLAAPLSASAEGFTFNWDSDDNQGPPLQVPLHAQPGHGHGGVHL